MVNIIQSSKNFSSNVNEVIRAVSNLLQKEKPLRKDFAHTKAPKAPKSQKAQKTQKRNQAKV